MKETLLRIVYAKKNEKVNTIEKNSSENVPNDEKKAKAIDKREEKEYDNDNQHSRRISDDGRKENRENGNEGAAEESKIRRARDNSRWRGISYTDDGGRIRQLYGIVKNERHLSRLSDYAHKIYTKPKTETQESLQWQAQNEEINLYFVKSNLATNDFYVLDDNKLFINENATEKQLVDILNIEKPIQRNVDYTEIAKISQNRWDSFLAWKPDAYITRMPIQQFLDMVEIIRNI